MRMPEEKILRDVGFCYMMCGMWEIAIEEKWERDAGFGPSTGRSIKPFLPAGIKKHGARGEGRGGGSSLL